jgi:hypothetical protein
VPDFDNELKKGQFRRGMCVMQKSTKNLVSLLQIDFCGDEDYSGAGAWRYRPNPEIRGLPGMRPLSIDHFRPAALLQTRKEKY